MLTIFLLLIFFAFSNFFQHSLSNCSLPETVQFFVHSLYFLVFSVVHYFPVSDFLRTVHCSIFCPLFFVQCPLSNFLSTVHGHCPAILSWSGGGGTFEPCTKVFLKCMSKFVKRVIIRLPTKKKKHNITKALGRPFPASVFRNK